MEWISETETLYEENEFGESVGFGERPAPVVIDLINAFTDPESNLGSDLTDVLDNTETLLEAFRDRDLPRYFTTVAGQTSSTSTQSTGTLSGPRTYSITSTSAKGEASDHHTLALAACRRQ
jgi:nicotinamidase-related amidase